MKAWLWNGLIWLDQGLNWFCGWLLNLLLVKPGGARFGHPDETLSSVMGKNVRSGTCVACTWICKRILHRLDPHHCETSIEADRGDVPAGER